MCGREKLLLHGVQDHLRPCFREMTSMSSVSFLLKSVTVLPLTSLRVGTSPNLILLGERVLLAVFSTGSRKVS